MGQIENKIIEILKVLSSPMKTVVPEDGHKKFTVHIDHIVASVRAPTSSAHYLTEQSINCIDQKGMNIVDEIVEVQPERIEVEAEENDYLNKVANGAEREFEMLLDKNRLTAKMQSLCYKHSLEQKISQRVLEMTSLAAHDRVGSLLEELKVASEKRTGSYEKDWWEPEDKQYEKMMKEKGDGKEQTSSKQKEPITLRDCIFVAENDFRMRTGTLLYKWRLRVHNNPPIREDLSVYGIGRRNC